ncbi:NmrA family NAD(P)-binding protein, partial [Staphylococcus aureus]
IAAELLDRVGPAGFAATARDPGKAEALAAKGVKVLKGDYDDPAGLVDAFRGAATLLLVSGETPVEIRIRQHRAAIDAAKAAGVGRVVYTSFVG